MARQQCYAQTRQHAFTLGFGRRDLLGLVEVHALFLEVLFAGQTRSRPHLAHQQGVGLKILQAQWSHMAQRMVGRCDRNDRIVQERQELQPHVPRHHGHDHQVVAVVRQALDHLGAIDHGKLQVHFRVLAFERGKQMRHEVFGAGFHRQFQLPLQRTLHVRQLHVEVFQASENIPAGPL
ncbi:hypothetical protein D9M73_163160 [compost metagenome]